MNEIISEDAKNLSQDILCEALTALSSGKKINDFYAWYWRMARNKYADYVRVKKNPELPVEVVLGVMVENGMALDSGAKKVLTQS